MGHLDLPTLSAVGDAVVRMATYVSGAACRQELLLLGPHVRELAKRAREGPHDPDDLDVVRTRGTDGNERVEKPWHRDFWHEEGERRHEPEGAAWLLRVGRYPSYRPKDTGGLEAGMLRHMGLDDVDYFLYLIVTANAPGDRDLGGRFAIRPTSLRLGGPVANLLPDLVNAESAQSRVERQSMRRHLQLVDAFGPFVDVVFDPEWKSQLLRESVMAQIAESLQRTRGMPQGIPVVHPELTQDAYDWWREWAEKAGGIPLEGERLSPAEMAQIVSRTVPPSHPAGHRKYWRKLLRGKAGGPGLVANAAREVGIARSTAHDRLQRVGKQTSDYSSCPDPMSAILQDLKAAEPKNRLDRHSRDIVKGLVELGMKENSARRFERRNRHLPKEERDSRLLALMDRICDLRRPLVGWDN